MVETCVLVRVAVLKMLPEPVAVALTVIVTMLFAATVPRFQTSGPVLFGAGDALT